MQSIVPDIFDNHSLAPNIKSRDNLYNANIRRETNGPVAYVPSLIRDVFVMMEVLISSHTTVYIKYRLAKAANNMHS